MPGRKLTMLPDEAIEAFTLKAGTAPPALTLAIEVSPDGVPLAHTTRVERVRVAANLRLDTFDGCASPTRCLRPATRRGRPSCASCGSSSRHLSDARGKNDINRIDYNFVIDWDAAADGRVAIVPRERGSPLDKLIAELMIHVNNTWGRLLADRGAAGLYRVQSAGKVKMSTRPGEHQGLGLMHYLWASSPLRRYSDLVNQRQILAVVGDETPPYAANDAALFSGAGGLRGDVQPVRRVPGSHGALLVPALAVAGKRQGNQRPRDPREPGAIRVDSDRRQSRGRAFAAARHAGAHRRWSDRPPCAPTLECRYAGPAVMTRP